MSYSFVIRVWLKPEPITEYLVLERTANEAHVKRLFSSESRIALSGLNLQKKLRKKKEIKNKNTNKKEKNTYKSPLRYIIN